MIIKVNGQNRSMLDKGDVENKAKEMYLRLSPEEANVANILIKSFKSGNEGDVDKFVEIYSLLHGVEFRRVPVSPDEFFNSEYYLGKGVHDIWDRVREDLISAAKGQYPEMILTGSIGWGKSYFVAYLTLWVLYQISCLRSPAQAMGLSRGSKLSIAMMSVNEVQAKNVMFNEISAKVSGSPYFMEHFPFKQTQKEIRFFFPEAKKERVLDVIPKANTDNGVIGLNLVLAIIDEINFIKTSRTDKKKMTGAKGRIFSRQQMLYNILRKRIKSRFLGSPWKIGGIMLSSSKDNESDFTSIRMEESRLMNDCFVRDYTNWDGDKKRRSTKSFFVLVGKGSFRSKILSRKDIMNIDAIQLINEGINIIQVPEGYRKDFEDDIDGAIRDFGGRLSTSADRFFKSFDDIYFSFSKKLPVPYKLKKKLIGDDKSEVVLDRGEFYYEQTNYVSQSRSDFTKFLDVRQLCKKVYSENGEYIWIPRINPEAVRYIHVDGSRNDCTTGFAMGHIVRIVNIKVGDEHIAMPQMIMDLVTGIEPPVGGEICYVEIRKIIIMLRDVFNFKIKVITSDNFALNSMNELKQKGFEVEHASVDRSNKPYDITKEMMKQKLVKYPENSILMSEFKTLIEDPVTKKIDHPDGGTKDLTDAVAGCLYMLVKRFVIGDKNKRVESFGSTANSSILSSLSDDFSVDDIFSDNFEHDDFERVEQEEHIISIAKDDDDLSVEDIKSILKNKDNKIDVIKAQGDFYPEFTVDEVEKTPFDYNAQLEVVEADQSTDNNN